MVNEVAQIDLDYSRKMKLHFAGKYSGNESDLPKREHPSCAVKFKEPESTTFFYILLNTLSALVTLAFTAIAIFRVGGWSEAHNLIGNYSWEILLALILFVLSMLPHELLHGICFKDDIYIYIWPSKGVLFVSGVEDMGRSQFISMNLLPNVVFGFIPFAVFLLFPSMLWLGTFSVLSIGLGVGDYVNVISAFTQVPKNAKVYTCAFHSFWYEPSREHQARHSTDSLNSLMNAEHAAQAECNAGWKGSE